MAESLCYKTKGDGSILGMFNSPLWPEVLRGNIQDSHTGVHSSASSAN